MYRIVLRSSVVVLMSSVAVATIFGWVRGIVHDPQHRPIPGALVMLRSKSSESTNSVNTDANGEFSFNAVPLGDYTVSVSSPGFVEAAQGVVVNSSTEPVIHFQLNLAGAKETINVSGAPVVAPTDSATPITLVDRQDIGRAPRPSDKLAGGRRSCAEHQHCIHPRPAA